MFEAISHYVRNIAVFLVFTSFIGIILPDSKYKNYIHVVLGFILIFIMLEPVTGLLYGQENPMDGVMRQMEMELNKNIAVKESQYYDELKQQMVKDNFHMIIKQQVENILKEEHYGLTLFELDFTVDTGEIQSMSFTAAKEEPKEEAKPTPQPLIRIEKVRIQGQESPETVAAMSEDETTEIKNLKNKISDFYNLSKDNIYVYIQKNE